MDLNAVHLSGRLTADPYGRETNSGRQMARFRIAVHRNPDLADFFQIVAFDDLADDALHGLHKSRRVIVVGRLAQRNSDGDQVEIIATDIHFL